MTALLDPRFVRVLLAAHEATSNLELDPDEWDELCLACEDITDEELDALRATR